MAKGKAGVNTPTANDKVMTPRPLAKQCVDIIRPYFEPGQLFLEPCRGDGAFYDILPDPKVWCEIDEGRDYLEMAGHPDWVVTNPPFSQYEEFLTKAFKEADNVAFLVPILKVWASLKRIKKVSEYGGIRHFHTFKGSGRKFGFNFGFPMCFIYFERGYKGPVKFTGVLEQ